MMGVLWFKIFRDLWGNRWRTLQVMLIIGIGAASIGMILGTRYLVINGMLDMWHAINPAALNFYVDPPISEDDLYRVAHEEGIGEVEGLNSSTIEWRVDPQGEWKQGNLNTRLDYDHQRLNKLELVDGNWPRGEVVLVGQDAETFFKIPSHGKIYLRADKHEYEVTTGGMIYGMFVQPAYFGGLAQFYVTQDFYEKLLDDHDFNQFYASTSFPYEKEKATELADRISKILKKQDKYVYRIILDPNKHYFQDTLDGLFLLLGILGGVALLLGLLLVYNTINAYISQQVNQIGIMKAIGARTSQVLLLYLTTIFIFGILSLLVALPIGVFGAWGITSWLISSFGADAGVFTYSPLAVYVMIAITILAPLIASLIPVIASSRVTVREAISTYGLSIKTGLLEKWLAKAKKVSRLLLITIGNTFQHKRRVFLLQIALVLSGLMFMSVVSMHDSVVYSIQGILFKILNADITMLFEHPYPIDYLEKVTLEYPDVEKVEMWGFGGGNIRLAKNKESDDDTSIGIFGVPLPTELYGYQIRQGRWLNPNDGFAIVLSQKLAKDEGIKIGDWVTIKYNEKQERNWQVVGLVFDPILTTICMVPREVLLRDINQVGRSSGVMIKTRAHDPQSQIRIAKDLRKYYESINIDVAAQRGIFGGFGGEATTEVADAMIKQFNFLVVLLGIMAVVIATVGSIALSGALTMSVLERTREIGVMRAIGASSWSIARLFIGEGLILGWLSWLIALPLSFLAGQGMVKAIGVAFQIDLVYHYTPSGAVLWLVIITILSILASWLPARGATKISVRESLAYQ
jgi:putative ABC transport system permease protein